MSQQPSNGYQNYNNNYNNYRTENKPYEKAQEYTHQDKNTSIPVKILDPKEIDYSIAPPPINDNMLKINNNSAIQPGNPNNFDVNNIFYLIFVKTHSF